MKCPKCGYLGFEQVDRCRNCGYEFSLATPPPMSDLPLKEPSRPINPLEDLSFLKEVERAAHEISADLPLFESPTPDDVPLITKPSPPRQPLAVRRATPEVPRLRSEPRAQSLDLASDTDSAATPLFAQRDRLSLFGSSARSVATSPAPPLPDPAPRDSASLGARLVAVAIDLLILAVVDVLVVYLTMELCGITVAELGLLPKGPLLAFLVVQNGGYLVGFTAGGQTLGKMAMGIRVVSADEAEPLGVARALRRTLVWAILAIPAGLGFVTALLSSDHRGLHDRLAGTRVVRASA
jgi:uncharacterized RDD family membrane protein YckC